MVEFNKYNVRIDERGSGGGGQMRSGGFSSAPPLICCTPPQCKAILWARLFPKTRLWPLK